MTTNIRHKRSNVAGNKPTDSDLILGELAINTHDGVLFFERNKDGVISIREVENSTVAENVFYVSKSGSDSNDGTSLSKAFLTIDKACLEAGKRRGAVNLDSDGAEGSVILNKTRRDLGYYIDAATFDVALGTEFNRVFQGRAGSYTKGITEVLESIRRTKDLVAGVTQVSSDATSLARSNAYWDELTDIIQNGRNNADALDSSSYPLPTATYFPDIATGDYAEYSRNLLLNNKIFISEEVNLWAKNEFDIEYDSAKCKRDIRFAVEALIYDATYLGNAGTYDNANFFFFNGDGPAQISAAETPATSAAYDRMARVVEQILAGQTVTLSGSDSDYTQLQSIELTDLPDSAKISELKTNVTNIGNTIRYGQSWLTTNVNRVTPDNDSRTQFDSDTLGAQALAKDGIDSDKTTIIETVVSHIDSVYPLLFDIGDRYQDILDGPEIPTTIYVKTGDYEINNPIELPKNTSLIGDNLKNVSIRPKNKTSDMIYVNNNNYITGFTFRDHLQPAAAITWDPTGDSSTNVITNSPYIQNCSSITGPDLSRTDSGLYVYRDSNGSALQGGDGIRNDGSKVGGIRSIVVDSFTQINQGGKGVYILNRGYCQLVSVFTVYCDVGVLCETGGFGSITNSNCTFGRIGLKATGVSDSLYGGLVDGDQDTIDNVITLKGLTKRPNNSDAVKFGADPLYYTVDSASWDSAAGTGSIRLLEVPNQNLTDSDSVAFFQRSALSASSHTFEWVGTGTDVRTAFPFRGGIPIQANEVEQDANKAGLVFVTSTDQKGDFRVGEDFLIQRSTGTIEGDAFDRSLFARVTPFSLALED